MKLFKVLALIMLISFTTSTLYAQGNWEFGTEFSWFEYEEPSFMEEEGFLFGFFGTYTTRTHENQRVNSIKEVFSNGNTLNLFELDARIMFGEVDYTSASTGSLDDIDDLIFEVRGITGYDLPIFENSRLTPFFGFGYRYLNDDSGGALTTTGAAGYERESNYFYIPIGVELFTPLDNGWSVTSSVEYDIFIQGKQKSHLGDAIAGLNTVDNDQDGGYGVRGSIKIMKETERFEFFVEPYVRYWKVDDSQTSPITFSGVLVGFGLEPENKSLESGARVGIHF